MLITRYTLQSQSFHVFKKNNFWKNLKLEKHVLFFTFLQKTWKHEVTLRPHRRFIMFLVLVLVQTFFLIILPSHFRASLMFFKTLNRKRSCMMSPQPQGEQQWWQVCQRSDNLTTMLQHETIKFKTQSIKYHEEVKTWRWWSTPSMSSLETWWGDSSVWLLHYHDIITTSF